MSLEADLLADLKALRAGSGLTEARMREQQTLVRHLDVPTAPAAVAKLIELVQRISDVEQRLAVRYALGLDGGDQRQATQRREAAVKVIPMSLRTLDRREIAGLEDLARIIIEQSPELTEQQRQDEVDLVASATRRIEDLETVVSFLARLTVAGIDHGRYEEIITTSLDADWDEFTGALSDLIDRGGPAGRVAARQMEELDQQERRPPVDTSWVDDQDGRPQDVSMPRDSSPPTRWPGPA